VSVTVATTAPSSAPLVRNTRRSGPRAPFRIFVLFPFAVTALLLILAAILMCASGSSSRRKIFVPTRMGAGWAWTAVSLTLLSVLLWTSCGGGGGNYSSQSNPGTSAGSYSVTISATGGGITQTATLSLKVQ
jgi:hypothetical protein